MALKTLKFPQTLPLLLLSAAACLAQLSTTTQVNGTITDTSGAVIAGAAVTAVNEDTQVAATAQSNGDGSYVLTGLPVGKYTVTVTKDGFQTFKASDSDSSPGHRCHLECHLDCGPGGNAGIGCGECGRGADSNV